MQVVDIYNEKGLRLFGILREILRTLRKRQLNIRARKLEYNLVTGKIT